MKKRIAHIAGGLTTGGVEAVIYNYFSNMDRSKYELHYIVYGKANAAVKEKFEELGFTVHEVTKKKENLIKSCREVYHIFKKYHIGIVHSHMTLMCFVTSFLGWLCGAKVRIAHSHLAQYPTGIKKLVYALFKQLSVITATDYFACGREAGIYLFGKRRMQRGKVRIIHNAIDMERFRYNSQVRERKRKELGMGKDILCIGHIGRFTPQKNHDFLLSVFKEICQKNPRARLLSIGDGPLMKEIKHRTEEEQLADAVIFLGSREDVNEWYQAMDLFLLPSLYEGLAVVLIEAQCAGLKVFASDTVTEEISVSMQRIPLSKTPGEWADILLKKARAGHRCQVERKLRAAGYDIRCEAGKLDRFYQGG